MSIQDNDKLIRDFYTLLDNGDKNAALALLSPDATFEIIGLGESYRGQKDILQSIEAWGKSFPDMKCQMINQVVGENAAVVEEMNRGTHTGLIESPMGNLPATNRKVEVPAVSIFKLSGGKISSWKVYWQNDIMLRQLGYGPQKRAA